MEESVATEVVELLRARDFFAHVNRRAGVYSVGVRLVIPGGREVIWDNDGASGLEAMVLLDGDLVGFVPQVANSDDLSAAQVAEIIASTDYDAPPGEPTRPSLSDHASPEDGLAPPAPVRRRRRRPRPVARRTRPPGHIVTVPAARARPVAASITGPIASATPAERG